LLKSLVAQHRQTWKLQEYHLLAPVSCLSDPSTENDTDSPLSIGDPIRAHIPKGTKIEERPDGIDVQEPGDGKTLFYHRVPYAAPFTADRVNSDGDGVFVQDVLIMGSVGIFYLPDALNSIDASPSRDILHGANLGYAAAYAPVMVW
jgi:hypothetical protein